MRKPGRNSLNLLLPLELQRPKFIFFLHKQILQVFLFALELVEHSNMLPFFCLERVLKLPHQLFELLVVPFLLFVLLKHDLVFILLLVELQL